MNAFEIQTLLEKRGFEEFWFVGDYDREKVKAMGFSHPNYGLLYLKRNPDNSEVPQNKMPLVISGEYEEKLTRNKPPRNYLDWEHARPVYYNSNLRGFPSRVNPGYKGKKADPSKTQYGIAFNIDSEQGLDDLLRWLVDEDKVAHNLKMHHENSSYEDSKVLREIKTRSGQPAFRKDLMTAFNSRCCVTGCKVEAILEAAHIISHSEETNYSVSNGLLLRADIHTLFDLDLIGLDHNGIVHIHRDLKGSEYDMYEKKKVLNNIPKELEENLKRRFENCGLL